MNDLKDFTYKIIYNNLFYLIGSLDIEKIRELSRYDIRDASKNQIYFIQNFMDFSFVHLYENHFVSKEFPEYDKQLNKLKEIVGFDPILEKMEKDSQISKINCFF